MLAREALETLINSVIDRHGTSISTKPHALLADFGEEVYSQRVVTPVYSGYRIHPAHRKNVLRRTVEIGIQTITQLPSRYPVAGSPRTRLKSLAGAFVKAAGLAGETMGQEEVRKRVELYFEKQDESRRRLLHGFDELRWCAQTVDAISKLRVKRLRLDSPNPQVSLALYIANWLESATGNKRYAEFTTLLDGSFGAAKRPAPRWLDRLAIEMHDRKRRREEWMRRISTS